jgi:ribosomal protein S18 acetylase RimI-like enzyme
MQIHRYRRELARPLMEQAPVYPYVMRTIRFAHVPALHALLHEVHAANGSALAPRDEWWRVLSTDPEFDPRLVLIVETPIGTLAAAAVAWNTGFVKDLAVAPDHRRLGLASALLGHVFQIFHSRGAHAVDLKVPAHNHAAIALVEAMGLRCVETIEARAA